MDDLKKKSDIYREIRKRVWNEATYTSNPTQHKKNKDCLMQNIERLCKESDLSEYQGNLDNVKRRIWNHLWTKIRYAGIKADIASKEISDIASIFDRYEDFSKPDWDIKIEWDKRERKHVLIQGGACVHDFLNSIVDPANETMS